MSINKNLLPEIILVNPQLPENLGAVARAMLNFYFKKLRVVNPKFDIKNEKIIPVSAGAEEIINKIKIFDSFNEAIKDLNYIVATTNRVRSLKKDETNFTKIAKRLRNKKKNEKIGIVFGPENSGLDNDHISLADNFLKIPSNPQFSSLNLSHAVMVVCYELIKKIENPEKSLKLKENKKNVSHAKKKELINFYNILEKKLESSNFFLVSERKKITIQKIRNIFSKSHLKSNEINILIGMIKSLEK